MDINITGNINFFATKRKGADGNIRTYCTTSITRAFTEGEPKVKRTIDLTFDKTNFPAEKIQKLEQDVCYQFKIEEGWLTLHRFKKSNDSDFTYNIGIYIKKGEMQKATKVDTAKKEEALKAWKASKEAKKNAEDSSPLEGSEKSTDLPW